MEADNRYFPARNMKGGPSGLCPKHAQRWAQYSNEWYRACDEAYVNAMWKKLGLRPIDPREWSGCLSWHC